jgi:hypothetical protein
VLVAVGEGEGRRVGGALAGQRIVQWKVADEDLVAAGGEVIPSACPFDP